MQQVSFWGLADGGSRTNDNGNGPSYNKPNISVLVGSTTTTRLNFESKIGLRLKYLYSEKVCFNRICKYLTELNSEKQS